jgi:hypothetical protein
MQQLCAGLQENCARGEGTRRASSGAACTIGCMDDRRAEARRLRERGLSLREIASTVGAALGSVSLWTRDIAPATVLLERIGAERLVGPPLPVAGLDAWRRCGRCGITLPLPAFGRGQWRCRRCFREYFKERGNLHRAQSRAALEVRRRRAQLHLLGYLQTHACTDCGEDDPVVREFDHVLEKRANVGKLAQDGAAPARLDAEIALCEVVCVCCHRRRTAARRAPARNPRPGRLRNARYVRSVLDESSCVDCGATDPSVLDFDHVGTKTDNITNLVMHEASLERLVVEIANCVIRCANCHRRRTSETGGHFRSRQP